MGTKLHLTRDRCLVHRVFRYMVDQPISAQIRAVANLCKSKYKNEFFRDRQMGLRKNASEINFFWF